jgi:hypothetical protein
MVAFAAAEWRVDPEHVLLTGLSDGATFALLGGFFLFIMFRRDFRSDRNHLKSRSEAGRSIRNG